jgi:hypothetical protein
MTAGGPLVEVGAVVVPSVAVLGLYISTRNATRERVAAQRRERERELDRARDEGYRSREMEVQRLLAERDDARYDRKRAEERSDYYEREYNRLRDQKG